MVHPVPVHHRAIRRNPRPVFRCNNTRYRVRLNPRAMKQKRKRRVFIQKMLFDTEEMRLVEESCRRTEYTDYWRGAVDMMLAMLQGMPRERATLRNLNRVYMEAVCRAIIKDRDTLQQFRQGGEWRFYVERDGYGEIKGVTAKIDNKSK